MTLKYKKIGIPRSFYFHSFPGLFETFFQQLGAEVILSAPSDKTTLQQATHVCEAEHCLPNKLFDGHVRSIASKVDAVFVPRLISLTQGYISCPRFGALPEATRAWLDGTATVLTIEINETKEPLQRTLERFARELGASSKRSRTAIAAALKSRQQTLLEIRAQNTKQQKTAGDAAYLLFGHPYTLHDRFIAAPILRKLKSLQVPVERMSFDDVLISPTGEPTDILWCTFAKMHHRLESLDPARYAGVIQITTFNCGCDSMMMEKFRRLCKRRGIPYMILMVDEHTGRAGLDTRLEAFVDSISWKRAGIAAQCDP